MWSNKDGRAAGDAAAALAVLRMVLGALAGAVLVFAIAPHCIGWFSVPTGGIGAVTLAKYPKGFDYFVVFALTIASAIGAFALSAKSPTPDTPRPTPAKRTATILLTIAVFIAMFVVHDHPYSFMEMFHEGEHLTPASVMLDGGKPYGDIFFLHGFATDGGLDALVLGSKPSPKKTRRMETVLDAAALAMLVPIAAEVVATTGGLIAAVILALCAIGAFEVPVFPYFRWLPLLIAAWALLRHARTGGTLASSPAGSEASRASALSTGSQVSPTRDVTLSGGETPPGQPPGRQRSAALYVAAIASSLGVLWSLDVGICAVAATVIVTLICTRRVTLIALIALAAIAAPLLVLLVVRADLHHFFRDSFVIIPRAIDAIWSLSAKPLAPLALLIHPVQLWDWLASEAARYYLPPVFFGLLIAMAIRKRDMRIAIVAIFSIILFRTAAGRCSWSHTRFAIPLLGIAVVAYLIEPLFLQWIRNPKSALRGVAVVITAVLGFRYLEIADNATLGWKFIAGWPARQRHEGMLPYPMARGRGIYTYAENASDLAALRDLAQRAGPGPIFDLSGERALYFLLDRRPATRCPDIAMLSNPELSAEALQQLASHPPVLVVLEGTKILGSLDGITNRDRVPPIAAWIDAHYPARVKAGRYLVAFAE
ncbi:MAG: hypothetical protein QOK37_2936 [Thermoanaerobaculia bacterium]|jgi:hypothetical protein|nr:hypothetical protein [Thermoanaerobaculia bacterium]